MLAGSREHSHYTFKPARVCSSSHLVLQMYFDINAIFMLIQLSSHPGLMKELVSRPPNLAMEGVAEPAPPDSACPSSPHPGPLQAPHALAATTKPALKPHPQSQPSLINDAGPVPTSIHPSSICPAWSSCPVPGVAFAHPFALVCTCTCTTTATLPHPRLYSQRPHTLAHVLLHPPTSQEESAVTNKPPHAT
ncbi:hypothetical protein K439DRAFT_1617271 [Ramaria rubella]|nr:hypothetical protein K439DRAFT_1617271 [Ramaria rubella]